AESTDILTGEETVELTAPRVDTINDHGTGCTLSAAIAALLPQHGYEEAVRRAKDYLTHALRHADELDAGAGHGPVNHFHALWKNAPLQLQGAQRCALNDLRTFCASKTTPRGRRQFLTALCRSFSMAPSTTLSWPATWC